MNETLEFLPTETGPEVVKFIATIEAKHFRTVHDTGASPQCLGLWNLVRGNAGLPRITWDDLAAYCETHKKYHADPCVRKQSQYDHEDYIKFYQKKGIFPTQSPTNVPQGK